MACERTHVDDTSYRRLVAKEKEADWYSLCLKMVYFEFLGVSVAFLDLVWKAENYVCMTLAFFNWC